MGEYGGQGMSAKTFMHFGQNQLTERFQEFSDQWAEGVHETELVPLELIDEVPITMMIAPYDVDLCQGDSPTPAARTSEAAWSFGREKKGQEVHCSGRLWGFHLNFVF